MSIPLSDWWALVGAVVGLVGLVGVGNGLRRWGMAPAATRRIVHGGVGLAAAGLPLLFEAPTLVYGLAALFVVVNAIARGARWWQGIHAARPDSWGTVMMPVALLVALAATWSVSASRIPLLQVAFVVVAVADPLAAWAGERAGSCEIVADTTVVGSSVFFGATVLVTAGAGWGLVGMSMLEAGAAALLVAVPATVAEGVSRRGTDNLWVVVAVLLVLVPLHEGRGSRLGLLAALVGGSGFGVAAYRGRALTRRGAVGGGLFAATLVAGGGPAWVGPGLAFFVLSSLLSRLPRGRESGRRSDEGPRSLRQVLANGGVAWAALMGAMLAPPAADTPQALCHAGFLGALATAAADTWATELGTRYAGAPWSLRTFGRVAPGTSGAVSGIGTLGAVLGAASVAVAGLVGDGALTGVAIVTTSLGAGLAGMAADSLAGATLQGRYRDPDTQSLVEQPIDGDAPIQGWSAVDNDVVNWIGTATGGGTAVLLHLFL